MVSSNFLLGLMVFAVVRALTSFQSLALSWVCAVVLATAKT